MQDKGTKTATSIQHTAWRPSNATAAVRGQTATATTGRGQARSTAVWSTAGEAGGNLGRDPETPKPCFEVRLGVRGIRYTAVL